MLTMANSATNSSDTDITSSEKDYDDGDPRVLEGDVQETKWQYSYQRRRAGGIKVSLSSKTVSYLMASRRKQSASDLP